MGLDNVQLKGIMLEVILGVLKEVHKGLIQGHMGPNAMTQKGLLARLWCGWLNATLARELASH